MESSDCLPKTHVSAKPKRRRIGTDTCPVPESEKARGAGNQQERLGRWSPLRSLGILRDYTPDAIRKGRDDIVRSPRRRGERGRNVRAPGQQWPGVTMMNG